VEGPWTIAIVRAGSELQELRIAGTRDFTPPTVPKVDAPADEPFGYRSSRVALGGSREEGRRRLQAAWAALGRVIRPDAETLVYLVTVLLGTVPWVVEPSGLSAPDLGTGAIVEPRATAAHPRAYRGTKHKPPRERRPDPVDLRPYLDDPAQLRVVLLAFAPAFEAAREGLLASGIREDRIGSLAEAIAAGVDPLIAYHVGRFGKRITSDAFRTQLLPSCLGATPAEVKQALALHEQLRLDARPELLAAVGALFAAAGPEAAIRWCKRMAAEAEEDQPLFAAHLVATGAFERDPGEIRAGDLETIRELAPESAYRSWHHSLFRAVARGVPMDYLFTGFWLWRPREYSFDFGSIEPCFDFPCATLPGQVSAHERSVGDEDDHDYFWFQLWRHAADLPGLGAIAAKVPWGALGMDIARRYLAIFDGIVWTDRVEREKKAKWTSVAAMAGPLLDRILATPLAYRAKAISYFAEAVWRWDLAPTLQRVLPRALLAAERLARPPFGTEPDATEILSRVLAHGDDATAVALLAAPDASFRRLEAAFRRTNNAWAGTRGLSTLIASDGELVLACFRDQPTALFTAARALGSLSPEAALLAARRLAAHPLSAPITGAAAILQRLEECSEAAGLPGKLRRLRQEDGERLSRAEPALRKHLFSARLACLERFAREALAGDLGADLADRNAVHALELMSEGDGNKRALRRFLKTHFEGNTRYLERHAETRAWFARHPMIEERLWTVGIESAGDIAPHGPVAIAMEHDPLEALKLGTYVGSCLSPGGLCAYSAGCVVLDVNKQVLYARDARRTVVARQLVAISREGELVCFSVYPRSTRPALKALFREHDAAFAAALGVPLHRDTPGGKGYTIELVIAHEWWDDDLDYNAPDSESTDPASAAHKASR
jgi:hypothetical protein